MAEGFKSETAYRIFDEIAASPTGLDLGQLESRARLNTNTLKIYCRRLAEMGAIAIESEPKIKNWKRNIYLAIARPDLRSDRERLDAIAEIVDSAMPRKIDKIREILKARSRLRSKP